MATPPATDTPQQASPREAGFARSLAAARKLSAASTQLMGAGRDALTEDIGQHEQATQGADLVRGIQGIQQELLDNGFLRGGQTDQPNFRNDLGLAKDVAERTTRMAMAVESGNAVQALKLAIVEGNQIGTELRTAISQGSTVARVIVLVFSIASDFIDIITGDLAWWATFLIKAFVWFVLWRATPAWSTRWRGIFLRTMFFGLGVEAFPVISILPIQTLSVLWLFNSQDKERAAMSDQLSRVEEHVSLLTKVFSQKQAKKNEASEPEEEELKKAA